MTFVALIIDQFVERLDGPFELQKQDAHVFRKTGTLSSSQLDEIAPMQSSM